MGGDGALAVRAGARGRVPGADVDRLLPAAARGDPRLARRRPGGAGRRCASRCGPDQRGQLRARERGDAHVAGSRSSWRSRPAGPTPRTAPSRRSPYAYEEQARYPARPLGEAAGQAAADPHDQDVHRRAAWGRPRHRLHHLPDVELVPGAVRLASPPATRARQAAPAGGPAAGDHRLDRPRGARRGRLRRRTSCALAAERPSAGRLAAELAVRPEVGIVDFTGSTAFGDWLEAQRPAGAGLHREGRRQHRRDRLDRRLPGDARQPRLLALACTRARCAPRPRTCWCRATASTPTAGTRRRTSSRADLGHADRRAARRRRAGGRAARRGGQRRRAPAIDAVPAAGARRRRVPGAHASRVPGRAGADAGDRRVDAQHGADAGEHRPTGRSASGPVAFLVDHGRRRPSRIELFAAPSGPGARSRRPCTRTDDGGDRGDPRGRPRRGGRALGEPHRRGLRQPDRRPSPTSTPPARTPPPTPR